MADRGGREKATENPASSAAGLRSPRSARRGRRGTIHSPGQATPTRSRTPEPEVADATPSVLTMTAAGSRKSSGTSERSLREAVTQFENVIGEFRAEREIAARESIRVLRDTAEQNITVLREIGQAQQRVVSIMEDNRQQQVDREAAVARHEQDKLDKMNIDFEGDHGDALMKLMEKMESKTMSQDVAKEFKKLLHQLSVKLNNLVKGKDRVKKYEKDCVELHAGKTPIGTKPFRMPFICKEWDLKPVEKLPNFVIEFPETLSFREIKQKLHVNFMAQNRAVDLLVEKAKVELLQTETNYKTFVKSVQAVASKNVESLKELGIVDAKEIFPLQQETVAKQAIQAYR